MRSSSCKKCAEINDKSNDHYWDSNLIVDLIDLTDPSNKFSWSKELFGKVWHEKTHSSAFKRRPKLHVTYGMKRHIF